MILDWPETYDPWFIRLVAFCWAIPTSLSLFYTLEVGGGDTLEVRQSMNRSPLLTKHIPRYWGVTFHNTIYLQLEILEECNYGKFRAHQGDFHKNFVAGIGNKVLISTPTSSGENINENWNKQCLLDSPRTVMVNKGYYREYEGHTKWLSLISSHFAKKHFLGITLLHAHAHYICIVCAKYQRASVKPGTGWFPI